MSTATVSIPVSAPSVNAGANGAVPVSQTPPAPKTPRSRKPKADAATPEAKPLTMIQSLMEAAGKSSPSVKPSVQFDRVVSFARNVGLPCASLLAFRDRILSLAAVSAKCRDSANGSRASVSLNIVDAIGKVKLSSGDAKAQREIVADLKRQWNKASRILSALECESDKEITLV